MIWWTSSQYFVHGLANDSQFVTGLVHNCCYIDRYGTGSGIEGAAAMVQNGIAKHATTVVTGAQKTLSQAKTVVPGVPEPIVALLKELASPQTRDKAVVIIKKFVRDHPDLVKDAFKYLQQAGMGKKFSAALGKLEQLKPLKAAEQLEYDIGQLDETIDQLANQQFDSSRVSRWREKTTKIRNSVLVTKRAKPKEQRHEIKDLRRRLETLRKEIKSAFEDDEPFDAMAGE